MEHLIQVIKAKEKDFEAIATVVLESTGHYHKILGHALLEHGIGVAVINPIQSDSIENLSIRKVKNDRTDAYHLAMLYVFERNSMKTAAAQAFLARSPLPENVLQARKSTVENLLKKQSRKGETWAQDKLVKILAKADTMRSSAATTVSLLS